MSTKNTHFGANLITEMLKNTNSVYFIGIGGVSMSSLAHISKSRGFSVGGSDRTESEITRKLQDNGIRIFYGHDAANLTGYGAVVYTVAISDDNPEYVEAKRLGLPLISRADYLGYIMMTSNRRLGVAGMHGKSTCTSMCASVYIDAGVDPTIVSGAEYSKMGGLYRVGNGENFIFEACEYMDSFLDFNPTTAIILNVELEHVDYFKTLDRVISSYAAFAELTGENGTVIVNSDDENAMKAIRNVKGKTVTFGLLGEPDYKAVNIAVDKGYYSFDLLINGEKECGISLNVTGRHNIYNALATAAAAYTDGIGTDAIVKGLESFNGAKRRMEYKGTLNGGVVYDDYGHHPTEISATLEGAGKLCGQGGRLVCAFQPHTYSRTEALFDDFVSALGKADRVYLIPIYAAREENLNIVSSAKLASAIGDKASYVSGVEELAEIFNRETGENDTVVIMGAGNIDRVYKMLNLEEANNVKEN